MAKKKTQQYQDRKYNYPKGFTKYGKSKTGFMPAAQGAKVFVTNNFEQIKKGTIPFDSLTQREKRVYRGKTNKTFENLYTFQGKSYYDPTRTLRVQLENVTSIPKGARDLTNYFKPEDFKERFNQLLNPTKYADGTNSTLFDFVKGDKKKFYRDESGTLLDIVTRLNKVKRSGRNIEVIDTMGEKHLGVKAIDVMRTFESDKLLEYTTAAEDGERIQLQIVYLSTKYNPFTNTVIYKLNDVQVNNLNQTP